MTSAADLTKLVPGFDFLQNLMKSAGQTLPNMNQWIAPTLDAEEINKRIEQLKTVQFWLEQNSRMLAASIQALEVQRMTLSTLKSMNMPLDGLRDAFNMKMPEVSISPPAPAAAPQAAKPAKKSRSAAPKKTAAGAPNAAVPDPMQWWGALTQQFSELAANALKDNAAKTPSSNKAAKK